MDKFTVKKSYRGGHVGLRFSVKANYIKIEGGSDLSTEQARDLARILVDESDRADARVAAKKASEDRRQKWRDREIAAGRIKIMGTGEFFQRR